jgi:glycosyltransferase involved in cell wall biosynthesis
VAPYSRAIRIARALAAEGLDVEIAAVAAPGLPEREPVTPGRPGTVGVPESPSGSIGEIEIRRYRPSGAWRLLGASEAAAGAASGPEGEAAGARSEPGSIVRQAGRAALRPLLTLRRWLLWPHAVRGWWATLERELGPADLYHACGALAIRPALAKRPRSGRVIYDAIDDVAGSNETTVMPVPIRRRIAHRERDWARAADAVVTVNETLVDRLTSRYGRTDDILVVPNYPEPSSQAGETQENRAASPLRSAAGLPTEQRIVLFQGRLGPGLGLDSAAEAILSVPNAALVLMGFGRGFAASVARDRDPRFAGRHVTLPAVNSDELAAWTAGADVMLIPLPPTSANQRAATPNKFWEALAVGVPVVVVHGLTAMEELVTRHDLGGVAVSPSPADLAAAIRTVIARLDTDGPAWRSRIAATSRDEFSWPAAATAYRTLARRLLSSPDEPRGGAPA